jgi:hypothetical protein
MALQAREHETMTVQILWQTLGNWRQQNGFLRKHVGDSIIPDDEARSVLMLQEIHPTLRGCLAVDQDWQVTGLRGVDGNMLLVVGLPQAPGYTP